MIRLLATKSADVKFRNVHDLGFDSYVATVRDLLVNSSGLVVVITPFMDSEGERLLEEAWRERPHDRGEWHIYVRSAREELRRKARAHGWKLFEYCEEASDHGMHAKIVASSDRVIVGSMNLWRTSLYTNLEVGVETDDPTIVHQIMQMESWLMKASSRVQ